MNYTEGEWTANKITTQQGIKMAGGYQFAVWANTTTPTSIKAESLAFIKYENDAQLIAAAPDMYELLKWLVEVNDIAFLPLNTQDKIRKVIAKAEGC